VTATTDEARQISARARGAADVLRGLATDAKNAALLRLADLLASAWPSVAAANAKDVAAAEAAGRAGALLDRLRLTPERLAAVAAGVRDVARLEDPVGAIVSMSRRPNGMRVGRVRAPIGVILMIYEARPNVTIDAAALCLKAGNAIILRGGSEARHTNVALGALFPRAGFPDGAAQIVENTDRGLVQALLRDERIDVVIPRGNEGLIRAVAENARMPVLKHYKGVTHLFVDRDGDLASAAAIAVNAKTSRPSTCNALETMLVDAPIAAAFLPDAVRALREKGVEVRGCARTAELAAGVTPAAEEDWAAEYLDLILSVRVVDGFDDALAHIRRYSTGLAEAIVTNDHRRAMRFVEEVDSAVVLVNASTRLVDGAEFGLGAEIGISTNRIGPRGPMGLAELTTEKWVVLGDGHVR
jgi:glutamate-5-semialdehyde dehydrogenase